jgi:hypothetical protein
VLIVDNDDAVEADLKTPVVWSLVVVWWWW